MKENKLPSLISLLILTLITSIMWIGFGVYRAFTVKQAPIVPVEVIKTLNPTLDSDTIGKIQSSIFLDSSQIPQDVTTTTQTPGPTKAPTVTTTPTATPPAIPTPPAATNSAITSSPTPTP